MKITNLILIALLCAITLIAGFISSEKVKIDKELAAHEGKWSCKKLETNKNCIP